MKSAISHACHTTHYNQLKEFEIENQNKNWRVFIANIIYNWTICKIYIVVVYCYCLLVFLPLLNTFTFMYYWHYRLA